MEAISYSPAASLKSLPIVSTNKGIDTSSGAAKQHSPKKAVLAGRSEAATKPKQIKSRNGCSTCKAKRLKCDETKPSCNQCIKRKVVCGGYSKNFKWRSFEETMSNNSRGIQIASVERARCQDTIPDHPPSPLLSDHNSMSGSTDGPATPRTATSMTKTQSLMSATGSLPSDTVPAHLMQRSRSDDSDRDMSTSQSQSLPIAHVVMAETLPGLSTEFLVPDIGVEYDHDLGKSVQKMPDLVPQVTAAYTMPPNFALSKSLHKLPGLSLTLNQPRLAASSPEMLARNFDRNTCGILSIRDGLSENPWRTLIWPMARESPALYHAIASLSAFHCSASDHQMKYSGMKHMNQSISYLCKNIKKMKVEDTLATSLTLAFADTWDNSISTGIEHVRGGSALIGHALAKMKDDELLANSGRLRFLCKTWLYMDVLSRLTSNRTHDVDMDSPLWSQIDLLSNNDEIDPLLGCASTLYPIIGRVANLISRVRKTQHNTISLTSKAMELKHDLTNWTSPSYLEPAEDPTCDVQHAIQTAEAYQYATLLYLHQAVPEIPSLPATDLAQKVLMRIANIPMQSRTIIIQIYPMLAATCELVTPEDRAWALERWQQMQRRMRISNIDRCIEVMQEVWRRRDQAGRLEADEHSLLAREQHTSVLDLDGITISASAVCEELQPLPFERTVRGSQHWAGVMMEFGWEIFLG